MRLRNTVLKKHRLPKYLWILHTLKKLIKSHSLRQDPDLVLDVRIRPKRSGSATLLKGQYISVAEQHNFYASSAPGKILNAAPALTLQSVLRTRSDPDLFGRIRTSGTGRFWKVGSGSGQKTFLKSRIRNRSKIVRIRNSTTGIKQVNLLKNELLQFVTFLQITYAKFELWSRRSRSRIKLWLRLH
jgi:hypothetical protein